jgi:DNA-binding phage protein
MPQSAGPIRFRRNIDIGAADAENDALYLEHCFVDIGDVDTILNCANPKCIVLGRTGVGKTALIRQISKKATHVAEMSPETLSLHYITNSNVLQFFEEAGVHLDIFYSLLWRHTITVELLKLRFNITNEERQVHFYDYIRKLVVRDRAKERALAYLSEWGSKFWTETEYRTTEFTHKLENDLRASAKLHSHAIGLGAEGAKRLSWEERIDVRNRGTEVVNAVQVKALHDVVGFLSDEIFQDSYDKYYLVIDRLDENLVVDTVRFKLIKALIEAVRTFKKVTNVKISFALRTDLLYRLVRESSDPGFQEEKYRALYLNLRWTRPQLTTLLDSRVSYMFERQYTRQGVTLDDIMPKNQMEGGSAIDYVLDRTFERPRESIIFLNECIARAEGVSKISTQIIRQSELGYSQQRLTSVADEWRREYPALLVYVKLLEGRVVPFRLSDVPLEVCRKFAWEILTHHQRDIIVNDCEEFYTGSNPDTRYPMLETVVEALYHVGMISVKPGPHLPVQWSFEVPFLSKGQMTEDTLVDIHKTFYAALGVTPRGRSTKYARREVAA